MTTNSFFQQAADRRWAEIQDRLKQDAEITTQEAEVLFGVKENTLRVWRRRGHITGRRIGRRQLLFKRAEIHSLVEKRLPQLLTPTI
jgi:excisionase family DNA binding protein